MPQVSTNPSQNSCTIINLRCASALIFELLSKENTQDEKILSMARELIEDACAVLDQPGN